MNNVISAVFTNVLISFGQVIFTFILTFSIYMILAIADYEGGIDSFVGIAIFHPIIGAIICFLTILVCVIIGLPIRLVSTINKWWTNHFAISVSGILLGIILIIVSVTPLFRETVKVATEGTDRLKEIPNTILSITGWFVTAFCALHVFPPKIIRTFLDKVVTKLFPQLLKS